MLFGIILLLIIFDSYGQKISLYGEYKHKKKGVFYSTYFFDEENFTLIESGDLGIFYGKGKYKNKNGILILNFDIKNLDKEKAKDYLIIQPKTDTLFFKQINRKIFYIEYTLDNGKKYRERYKKSNAKNCIACKI